MTSTLSELRELDQKYESSLADFPPDQFQELYDRWQAARGRLLERIKFSGRYGVPALDVYGHSVSWAFRLKKGSAEITEVEAADWLENTRRLVAGDPEVPQPPVTTPASADIVTQYIIALLDWFDKKLNTGSHCEDSLGLTVVRTQHSVERNGRRADFGRNWKAWQLFLAVYAGGSEGRTRKELLAQVWPDGPVLANNVDKQKAVANEILVQLHVEIATNDRGIFSLVDLG